MKHETKEDVFFAQQLPDREIGRPGVTFTISVATQSLDDQEWQAFSVLFKEFWADFWDVPHACALTGSEIKAKAREILDQAEAENDGANQAKA